MIPLGTALIVSAVLWVVITLYLRGTRRSLSAKLSWFLLWATPVGGVLLFGMGLACLWAALVRLP